MGGGDEGWGGCGGRGGPPGRKLNINQSIAVSTATQRAGLRRRRRDRRGGGEAGRKEEWERGGEDLMHRATKDGWLRNECGARRWPRPTDGCVRALANAGAQGLVLLLLLVARPGSSRLAQPLGALVPARRLRRPGGRSVPRLASGAQTGAREAAEAASSPGSVNCAAEYFRLWR